MSKVQPDLIEQAKELTQDLKTPRQILRQKFIDALRSGKYKQVRRTLRSFVPELTFLAASMIKPTPGLPYSTTYCIQHHVHGFCTIGLAYEIMGKKKWPGSNSEVYTTVAEAYGLKTSEVIKLNDAGFSFEEIAQILETRPWDFWENSSTYQW